MNQPENLGRFYRLKHGSHVPDNPVHDTDNLERKSDC